MYVPYLLWVVSVLCLFVPVHVSLCVQSEKSYSAKRHQVNEYEHCPNMDCAASRGTIFHFIHKVRKSKYFLFC